LEPRPARQADWSILTCTQVKELLDKSFVKSQLLSGRLCHDACMATTSSEARYSNAGDRVCPACESDFVEITEVPATQRQPVVRNFVPEV